MAFGLGFDKAKILQTAEKYVIQGKINDAISEYKKILKKDPKDLMTLNTVGDLYARSGKADEALKIFYELAEKSVEAGFVPRAIAVYKRITKMDPGALQALAKLGELYSMQGLMRDARTHYLQAVEIHMRRQDLVKAREVFEKVWLLDMDNPRLQRRMAELYAQTGKPNEAISTFLTSAERFLDANEVVESAATLDELAKLDPENADARILRGRLQLSQGEVDKAIQTLQSVPDLASNKGALNTLFLAYRQHGDFERSQEIATQLFDSHEDFAGLALLSEDMLARNDAASALAIYQQSSPKLESQGAFSSLIEGLRKILSINSSNVPALELLWHVYRRMGSIGEGRETAEQLAHAYVTAEEYGKAREVCAELVAMEPENVEHRRLLRQIDSHLGAAPLEDTVADATPIMGMDVVASEEVQASRVDTLPPREQALVKNSLTESEIYITYHQIQKAIDVLEAGLLEVPGNITLSEHLLPLYEQTRQFQKAAQCAEALTEAYVKLGDGERATRYGELIVSYEQKAVEPPPEPAFEPEAVVEQPASDGNQRVREIDLSGEWDTLAAGKTTAAPAIDGVVEEIEFYLQAGMTAEAATGLARLKEQAPDHSSIPDFERRLGIEPSPSPVVETVFAEEAILADPAYLSTDATADAATETAAEPEVPAAMAEMMTPQMEVPADVMMAAAESVEAAESTVSPEAIEAMASTESMEVLDPFATTAPPTPEVMLAPETAAEPAPVMAAEAAQPEAAWAPEPVPEAAPVSEPEQEIEFDDMIGARNSGASSQSGSFELALEEAPEIAAPTPQNQFASLAGELEKNWEAPAPPAKPSSQPAAAPKSAPQAPPTPKAAPAKPAAAPAKPAADFGSGFLDDVFAEFKEDVGESAVADGEDIETHYNMGVAFKEMALYDEAIGEFQKVHSLAEQSKDYSHLVQCCSLLATCFLEKGMPQLAVTWYQTALNSPGADSDSAMAILYELGSAYEVAGDRANALKSFLDVYARNIDYRNVADRIRDLQSS